MSNTRDSEIVFARFHSYLMEASTSIQLPDADDLWDPSVYLDYVRRNVPQMMSEQEAWNADLPKCNVRAARARAEGNELYQKKDYQNALAKYNESICWADGDWEDLAICYANRSAVWYEEKEYEFALANIALAKKHNYPERLMPKLQARELSCKRKIEENVRGLPVDTKLPINVEVNAKIPFVAKGIVMKELPRFGRSMVAEREFKVGNVILCETSFMTVIGPEKRYTCCQYCSQASPLLIPCPQCVSVMFCNDQCLKKGWNLHRFDCGYYDKITSIPVDLYHMAPKVLFYGLSLFNDNVEELMRYCKQHIRTGSNPLDLDYTKEDPLAAFKAFHAVKVQPRPPRLENLSRLILTVLYTLYTQQPLVRKLFASEAQKSFLLEYMFEYFCLVKRQIVAGQPDMALNTVASVCNHSCNPNTLALYRWGQLKFVVIRPIRKGDQICISYGPVWKEMTDGERNDLKKTLELTDCACEVCDRKNHPRLANIKGPSTTFYHNLGTMQRVMLADKATEADKLNALQQFIQRYAYIYPHDQLRESLLDYKTTLWLLFTTESTMAMRKNCLN